MLELIPVFAGALGGIARALVGWAKSKEKFNKNKFLKTLVLSTVLGGIVGVYIADPKFVFALAVTGNVLIEDTLKAFLKR